MSLFWIIFSYVLGSFPSGYIFSRLSKKNILEIGWRKTSGSNVFKNVGWRQGVLTGLFDVAKGYLAVYGAQKLGFPVEIQVLSGAAAVTGHNWSLFLGFAGGRGIGTFIGAFSALSWQVLLPSLLPLFVLAVIWDASIGTLLFLAAAIFFAYYYGQFETAGIFTIFSLAPILIKRLSPLREIKTASNKSVLVRNRLLFDDDKPHLKLRLKKILAKGMQGSGKVAKTIKPFAAPLAIPPKLGWRAAKYGAKLAKEKLPFLNGEKVVFELGPEDLKKMVLASTQKIVFYQEEINKINVFPVADKDTGYNLAATLLGIEGVISQKKYLTLRELSKDIREAAIVNARGNAGMIYTGYLSEVLDRIKHLETIDAFHLALAMQKGIKAARLTIAEPVEGTILDVVEAAGEQAFEMASIKKERNIIKVLEEAKKVSEIALAKTKEKLEVLRQNDVVDAGALGFVKILEAWLESLKGNVILPELKIEPAVLEPQVEEELKYQYDLVFSFKEDNQCDLEEVVQELSLFGDSIDILEAEGRVKIHIHTNLPERVREKIQGYDILEWRVEDMAKQVKKSVEKKPLGLIVGETADLPKEFLEKKQIAAVPFNVSLHGENSEELFYEKIRKAKKIPTAAVPPFSEYIAFYKKALEAFEEILVITLPSRISGAYSQARIARSAFLKPDKLKIYVFDSFLAGVAEGLAVMRAQELIEEGKGLEEVVAELKEFCPKVKLLGVIDDLRYGLAGGRFPYYLPKFLINAASFLKTLKIHFLFQLKDGKIKFSSVSRTGKVFKTLAREIEKQSMDKTILAAIGYTDNAEEAGLLKAELEKNPKIKILYTVQISPAIGSYTGPGALMAAFHSIDN